jgi:hypothetical protein
LFAHYAIELPLAAAIILNGRYVCLLRLPVCALGGGVCNDHGPETRRVGASHPVRAPPAITMLALSMERIRCAAFTGFGILRRTGSSNGIMVHVHSFRSPVCSTSSRRAAGEGLLGRVPSGSL